MKKTLILSSIVLATTPIATVVACSGDSDNKNQLISKETRSKIEKIIRDLNNPISELIVGKKIGIVDIQSVQTKIDIITSWVILESITLYKVDPTGKATQILAGTDAESGFKYRLDFSMMPTKKSLWEDSDNPTGAKIFTSIEFDVKEPSRILDPKDFKNLKFKEEDLKKLVSGQIPLSRLRIDDTGKSWKDKVSFTIDGFENAIIGTPDWNSVPRTQNVLPGTQIKAKIHYHPIGSFAWKTGNPFELKTSDSEVNNVQYMVDPEMMNIGYDSIIVDKKISVNLFYGFTGTEKEPTPGEGSIHLYSRTSLKSEKEQDPESFTDYTKMDITPITRFNPKWGEIFAEHDIDIKSLSSTNKFVNFKFIYKDFFKVSNELPFIMFDRDYTKNKLPYDNSANFNKMLKFKDDLIVYTYSIPYKI